MLNPATVRRRDRRTARRVRLADGARVSLRPIHSEDADEFARAFTRLSELSRQRRFLSVMPSRDASRGWERPRRMIEHPHARASPLPLRGCVYAPRRGQPPTPVAMPE